MLGDLFARMDPSSLFAGAWRRAAWPLQIGCGALAVGFAAWAGHAIAFQRALERLHDSAQQRLEVFSARLEGELARVEYLPSLLETSQSVRQLLADPEDRALGESVSRYLRSLKAISG